MPFNKTPIRWCDYTWNPVHGCSKTSEGCMNCAAERTSLKWGHTEEDWTVANIEKNVSIKRHYLSDRLSDPAWVFVNMMGDLCHPAVPASFAGDVMGAICDMAESCFQILSKHGPDRGRDAPICPDNVMLGVSVESPRRLYRIDWLAEQSAVTKFASFEPLVERIDPAKVEWSVLDWAIIGGESHPKADERREMSPEWAEALIREARRQDVAVFFKQHSGASPESNIEIDIGNGPERIEEFPDLPHGVRPAPVDFLSREIAADGGVTDGEVRCNSGGSR